MDIIRSVGYTAPGSDCQNTEADLMAKEKNVSKESTPVGKYLLRDEGPPATPERKRYEIVSYCVTCGAPQYGNRFHIEGDTIPLFYSCHCVVNRRLTFESTIRHT